MQINEIDLERDQLSIFDCFDQDTCCGRMSQEHSVPTKDKTSELPSKKSAKSSTKMPMYLSLKTESGESAEVLWEMDGVSLGEYSMHSFGVSPNEENESHLSQILEASVHPKYSLSARACQGILNRADRRGKTLPPMLRKALEQTISRGGQLTYSYQDREGCEGGGKGFLLQEELSTSLRTNNYQTIFQPTVAIEGNGSRESHHGDGYSETDKMYTLNTTEQHAVAYALTKGGMNREASLDVCNALTSNDYKDAPIVAFEPKMFENHSQDSRYTGPLQVANSITQQYGTGGNNQRLIVESCNWDGTQIASTLTTKSDQQRMPDKNNFSCIVQVSHPNLQDTTGALMASGYTKLGTQEATNGMFVVEQEVKAVDFRSGTEGDVNGTLQADASHNVNSNNVVRTNYIVRRLTPLECERLQGFPDGWTDIGEWTDSKGKKRQTSDVARYKALGNSICLPSWKWVLKRISAQFERDATMASLFDGIGGFPYLWEQINGKGSCLWASEIEDFPIAVTKRRFNNE